MKADEIYELSVVPPPSEGRVWRRFRQVLALATMLGPIPEGGERLLIVDRRDGRVVGEVRQRWADEFYDTAIRTDLRLLEAEDFAARWLEDV